MGEGMEPGVEKGIFKDIAEISEATMPLGVSMWATEDDPGVECPWCGSAEFGGSWLWLAEEGGGVGREKGCSARRAISLAFAPEYLPSNIAVVRLVSRGLCAGKADVIGVVCCCWRCWRVFREGLDREVGTTSDLLLFKSSLMSS